MDEMARLGVTIVTDADKAKQEMDGAAQSAKNLEQATDRLGQTTKTASTAHSDHARRIEEAVRAGERLTDAERAIVEAASKTNRTIAEQITVMERTKAAFAAKAAAEQAATAATQANTAATDANAKAAAAAAAAQQRLGPAARDTAAGLAAGGTAARAAAAAKDELAQKSITARQALGAIRPIAREAGASIGELSGFVRASRAGFEGLALAITGVVLFALEKAADKMAQIKERFEGISGSAQRAGEAIASARSNAEGGTASFDKYAGAIENATRGYAAFSQNKDEPGVFRVVKKSVEDFQPVVTQFFDNIRQIIERTQTSPEQAGKILDTLSESIKKTGTVTGDALQKVGEISPKVGELLASSLRGATGELQKVTGAATNGVVQISSGAKAGLEAVDAQIKRMNEINIPLKNNVAAQNEWIKLQKDADAATALASGSQVDKIDNIGRAMGRLNNSWEEMVRKFESRGLVSGAINLAKEFVDAFGDGLVSIADFLKKIPSDFVAFFTGGGMGPALTAVKDWVVLFGKTLWDGIKELGAPGAAAMKWLEEAIDAGLDKISAKIKSWADSLKSTIAEVFTRTQDSPLNRDTSTIGGDEQTNINRGLARSLSGMDDVFKAMSPSTNEASAAVDNFGTQASEAATETNTLDQSMSELSNLTTRFATDQETATTSIANFSAVLPEAAQGTADFSEAYAASMAAVGEQSSAAAGAAEGFAQREGDAMQTAAQSAAAGADNIVASMQRIIDASNAAIDAANAAAAAGAGGGAGYAKGGVFVGGVEVTAFAKGGIVTSPTIFPMANGAGLMGEAGPEAIMPLTRTSDGSLGVKTAGGDSGASAPIVTTNPWTEIEFAIEDQTTELRNAIFDQTTMLRASISEIVDAIHSSPITAGGSISGGSVIGSSSGSAATGGIAANVADAAATMMNLSAEQLVERSYGPDALKARINETIAAIQNNTGTKLDPSQTAQIAALVAQNFQGAKEFVLQSLQDPAVLQAARRSLVTGQPETVTQDQYGNVIPNQGGSGSSAGGSAAVSFGTSSVVGTGGPYTSSVSLGGAAGTISGAADKMSSASTGMQSAASGMRSIVQSSSGSSGGSNALDPGFFGNRDSMFTPSSPKAVGDGDDRPFKPYMAPNGQMVNNRQDAQDRYNGVGKYANIGSGGGGEASPGGYYGQYTAPTVASAPTGKTGTAGTASAETSGFGPTVRGDFAGASTGYQTAQGAVMNAQSTSTAGQDYTYGGKTYGGGIMDAGRTSTSGQPYTLDGKNYFGGVMDARGPAFPDWGSDTSQTNKSLGDLQRPLGNNTDAMKDLGFSLDKATGAIRDQTSASRDAATAFTDMKATGFGPDASVGGGTPFQPDYRMAGGGSGGGGSRPGGGGSSSAPRIPSVGGRTGGGSTPIGYMPSAGGGAAPGGYGSSDSGYPQWDASPSAPYDTYGYTPGGYNDAGGVDYNTGGVDLPNWYDVPTDIGSAGWDSPGPTYGGMDQWGAGQSYDTYGYTPGGYNDAGGVDYNTYGGGYSDIGGYGGEVYTGGDYAVGGDATIPGAGPPDSVLMTAHVSPGEHVEFTPPGRKRRKDTGNQAGAPIEIHLHGLTESKGWIENAERIKADIAAAVKAGQEQR